MSSGTLILLTVLTIVLVLVLVTVLVIGLVKIIDVLQSIGGFAQTYMGENLSGNLSLLAKARWGLRAIERQTAVIGPGVGTLNEGLAAVDDGLGSVISSLDGIVDALERQEGNR